MLEISMLTEEKGWRIFVCICKDRSTRKQIFSESGRTKKVDTQKANTQKRDMSTRIGY